MTSELRELAELCSGACHGDVAVSGVTSDSRKAGPGILFAAVPGQHVHGAVFAETAVQQGSPAVITDHDGEALLTSHGVAVPYIVVDDVAARLGEVAAQIYGRPADSLRTFAVTGTNGKTTTAYMVDNILTSLGRTNGLIGTVEIRLAGEPVPAALTTPMPADLQELLADLVSRGGTDLVMEASSHALAQGRTDPIQFDSVGFTNLTQDHLDFHKTLDAYFEAKASLFTEKKARNAVVTVDDQWGQLLYMRAQEAVPGTIWALAVMGDLPQGAVGWKVTAILSEQGCTRVTLTSTYGEEFTFATELPGDFNVANAALALLMVAASGVPMSDLPTLVSPAVPGRMELIHVDGRTVGPRVVVDFAHNTDALIKALEALRPTTRGKLIVLTGSAGDRDKGKRAAMGAAVARLGDIVIITDDDPHSEDPGAIREAIIAGTAAFDTPVIEIPDRGQAIERAITMAGLDDTILLAGRGHETIQDVGGNLVELDDRVEARRALSQRGVHETQEMN